MLPALATGDRLRLLAIDTAQHFTEPPPRYSEASLVKALEEHGIGRPSTYASIIQTLLYKKYCELINRRFVPTDLGKIVESFPHRAISSATSTTASPPRWRTNSTTSRAAKKTGCRCSARFWDELKKQVDDVSENVSRSDVAMERPLGIDPVSGRPVSVRFGRFGAFAQIGTRDDEEKPKFASLRPHQRMDDLTLPDALDLFQLPRTLGTWEDGHPIKVAIGRFGPYVQYGPKKYASLKKDDDPYTVTLDRARQVIAEKREIEANRIVQEFPEAGIQVLNGRYGPYITDGRKNGKIPKDRDPKSLTLAECQALLAAAPERTGNRWGRKAGATAKAAPRKPAASAPRKAAAKAGPTMEASPATAAEPAAKSKKAAKKQAPAKKKRTVKKQA